MRKIRRSQDILMIFSVILLLVLIYGLTVKTWNIQTVDTVGPQSGYPSLALDSRGIPHICYEDYVNLTNYNLKHATLNGSKWHIETIQSSSVFLFPRITFDSKDNPYIDYTEYVNSTFIRKYATLTGSNWTVKTIDNTNPDSIPQLTPSSNGTLELTFLNITSIKDYMMVVSVDFDSKGNPQIAFVNGSQPYGGNLIYAKYLDSRWNIQTIDFNISSVMPCLVIDSKDNPYITYNDRTTHALRYAEWTGSEWKIRLVEQNSGYSSLAIDAQDNIHVSYEASEGLMYADVSGSHWNVQRVDTNRSTGYPQLVLDAAGNPHIACHQTFLNGHGIVTETVAYATLISAVEMQPALFVLVGLAIFALVAVLALFVRKKIKHKSRAVCLPT